MQLREAKRAGLRIPPTLVTNDCERVREFYAAHRGRVIIKPFRGAAWYARGDLFNYSTNLLTSEDLTDDAAFANCPAIYQPYVEKAFEVRATLIGNRIFAGRMEKGRSADEELDSRLNMSRPPISPYEMPNDVVERCLRMAKALDLKFGCFDFIVTPSREHVFLEVNEMGQFLWVEDENPAFPLLAAFASFLINGEPLADDLQRGLTFDRFKNSRPCREFISTWKMNTSQRDLGLVPIHE